jgi:hypothetical protein
MIIPTEARRQRENEIFMATRPSSVNIEREQLE